MSQKIELTIASLRSAYAQGTKPEEIIEQVYSRIDEIGDTGIFLCLFPKEELRATAARLGEFNPDLPLWGIPFVIKDNIDVAGKPTTAACPDFTYLPDQTAFVVKRLQAAGALLLGKTNLDQFATGLVGMRTPYGAPKNTFDPDIVPGGSSSGSAVAVAHGMASFSLGTDTAGSGRVPAALNNIVGLKPTLGALSSTGVVPACRSLDTVSIFALTVADAYEVFSVAAEYDAADPFSKKIATPNLVQHDHRPKIGIPSRNSIRFEGDTAQAENFSSTIERLETQGAEITEIDFKPFYEIAEMLYFGPWVAERYVATESLISANPDALLPLTRKIIASAEGFSAADTFKGFYKLQDLMREVTPAIASCDALCVPSIPTFARIADLEADPMGPNNMLGTYTNFVNLMNLCAITVPAPFRADGRPGSVTFIAPAEADAEVASLGSLIEAWGDRKLGATTWPFKGISLTEGASNQVVRIAVCGAHMSGLPLNHTMTEIGARFVRAEKTANDYKFYALPSVKVARPGLVRTAAGRGASVALEIWDIPEHKFGGFMKTIPAPLSIGTIKLSSGENVNGFLCEAVAAEGGQDITELADWRKYISKTP